MTPQQILDALAAEAATLRAKMADNTLTDADRTRISEIATESAEVRRTLDAENALAATGRSTSWSANGSTGEGFTAKVSKAFADAAPVIGGPARQLALTPSGDVVADFDGRVIPENREAHTLLGAINREQTDAPTGQYLQQVARENNAATVTNGALKPLSDFDLEPRSWRLATVAHLSNPIQRQWLADYAALERFISDELGDGVNTALENFILEGGFDEEGGTVNGVLTTTGVRQTAFGGDALLTILDAVTNAREESTAVTGIVIRPSDWGAITRTQLTDRSFLFGSPSTAAPLTLNGVPVVLSTAVEAGSALVGDLKTITLRYRNSLEISWSESAIDLGTADTPQLRDLFRRNQLTFRAETRVALELSQPHRLHVAPLTEG